MLLGQVREHLALHFQHQHQLRIYFFEVSDGDYDTTPETTKHEIDPKLERICGSTMATKRTHLL
jgi:hypothetical protein